MQQFFKRCGITFACCMAGLFLYGLVKGFSIYHGYSPPGLEAGFACMLIGALPALVLSVATGLLMALLKR